MNKSKDDLAREIFQERIKKGLLGPGSDVFVDEAEIETEIISNYPLQRYFTGILFPEKQRVATFDDLADGEIRSETDEENLEKELIPEETANDENEEVVNDVPESNESGKVSDSDDELKISHSTFFPTNMGLTFCVADDVSEIEVEFSFGIYESVEKDIRIKCPEEIYWEFQKHPDFPFKETLKYENGYILLKRKLKGQSRSPRTGDFAQLDAFKKANSFRDSSLKWKFDYFEKLIGRTWRRKPIRENRSVKVNDQPQHQTLFEKVLREKDDKQLRIGYTVKTYKYRQNPEHKYIKIQLANLSTDHPPKNYSNANELLNKSCVFQAGIEIRGVHLKPFKSYAELSPLDKETEILNYFYKDKLSYGVGHNCSVEWNNDGTSIRTTFLPQYDVKDTKNSFEESDFENTGDYEALNECLDIYNQSYFSTVSKEDVISRLKKFVSLYGTWIEGQKSMPSKNKKIEDFIFNKLDYNLGRLQANIGRLDDDTIFKAFQLANTAMLIQIIISNDDDFAGKEKEYQDLGNAEYNSLDFFQNFDFNRLSFGRPKYRPFQLAFLLLNIDGITDLESDARQKIVDLIWFPTGGGKTEAYLAVAAFTIIYRRMVNESGYDGTSVIMRYTLRLLTAQQFERASRLICSLDFLRHFFKEELKYDPITIGMWVGMSSTPNSIKESIEKEEEIREECNKLNSGNNGSPESKNVFQVSSCAWCGTKLLTKNQHGNWVSGIHISGNGKNATFKIRCLNDKCHFHNELPIQVVDEMLYKKPPTLLFGTVDKFAMLAWRAEGHRFFNSLNDEKLPPDLIIQDELHLLTGPLGSITGIFESVIEILCTKGNRKPKIISSTATTRNTTEQIKGLYGANRDVNIFPPNGLTYADSFFAKEAKAKSKRRYIGFLPTGKSSIDTQLNILAHLLVARFEAHRLLVQHGKKDYETFDKYWTIVAYYNSLKDVGKIHNKVGDEISNFTSTLQQRLFGNNPKQAFNYSYLYDRDEELTSRIESVRIKQTLKRLEENEFTENTIVTPQSGKTYVQNIIDLVLATNMISVGIDIDRFNIMLINGQPRNIAEYIQASSRVGRKYKGLVIDLLDANRARDKSHFEHFIPFHQAFYKSVEPISLTPFTENTLNKMLTSLMITYVRHKVPGMAADDAAQHFQPEMLNGLKTEIRKRFPDNNEVMHNLLDEKLNKLADDWMYKIDKHNLTKYFDGNQGLLVKPSQQAFGEDVLWSVMQSMREIDTNSFIKKELPKIRNNG
jgi:hypothetical protein